MPMESAGSVRNNNAGNARHVAAACGVQEEVGGHEDVDEEHEGEEDASYPPIQADAAAQDGGPGGGAGVAALGSGRGSGPNTGSTDASGSTGTGSEGRGFSPVGSTSLGLGRSMHNVDLRKKLLMRSSNSEDMRQRRSTGGQQGQQGGQAHQREDGWVDCWTCFAWGEAPVVRFGVPGVHGYPGCVLSGQLPGVGLQARVWYPQEVAGHGVRRAVDTLTCLDKMCLVCPMTAG